MQAIPLPLPVLQLRKTLGKEHRLHRAKDDRQMYLWPVYVRTKRKRKKENSNTLSLSTRRHIYLSEYDEVNN